MNLLDRRFWIDKGIITLSGAKRPIPELNIKASAETSGGGGADTTASAGKYLSDKVFLEVQQSISPGSGRAKLAIEPTPRISAETQIGQQGQTGRSLTWTYDY